MNAWYFFKLFVSNAYRSPSIAQLVERGTVVVRSNNPEVTGSNPVRRIPNFRCVCKKLKKRPFSKVYFIESVVSVQSLYQFLKYN